MDRPAAWLVDNILKGTMLGERPVEQPTTLELRINRKVADALGLMFPYGLLSVLVAAIARGRSLIHQRVRTVSPSGKTAARERST
jgi:ABC-type uncharacterized transport system substrate-binding protein